MRFSLLACAAVLAMTTYVGAFELSSPAFDEGQPIPGKFAFNGFGCTRENVSPALDWSDAPDGTESFALMVHDPDAPTGGAGFWHWIALDIPASESGLAEGAGMEGKMPGAARMIRNDYGAVAYGGPCPPEADDAHRYNFTLYALPMASLETPDGASASLVGFLVNANAIGKATLQGTFDR